jgi:hypothetical protein
VSGWRIPTFGVTQYNAALLGIVLVGTVQRCRCSVTSPHYACCCPDGLYGTHVGFPWRSHGRSAGTDRGRGRPQPRRHGEQRHSLSLFIVLFRGVGPRHIIWNSVLRPRLVLYFDVAVRQNSAYVRFREGSDGHSASADRGGGRPQRARPGERPLFPRSSRIALL